MELCSVFSAGGTAVGRAGAAREGRARGKVRTPLVLLLLALTYTQKITAFGEHSVSQTICS